MKSLSNKNILVTGAAGGFGQEFIRQLLNQGANLVLTDINQEQLQKVSSEILNSIPNCKGKIIGVFGSDLSTKEGCTNTFTKASSISSNIDVLINNAGLVNYGYFHEIPVEKWEMLMQVNLMAPMYLSHSFMKVFTKRGNGHIVNIDSVSGFVATAEGIPYSTSKFAIRGFGMALHKEGKDFGVNVTNVYPFYSPTPLLQTPTDGKSETQKVMSFLYDSPELIVRSSIRGLRRNRLHVYPGILSRIIYFSIKFWPIVGKLAK